MTNCSPHCKEYQHGETRHSPECLFYPGSLSEQYDKSMDSIDSEVKKAINRHLVLHVPVPGDTRCRLTILAEEVANVVKSFVTK